VQKLIAGALHRSWLLSLCELVHNHLRSSGTGYRSRTEEAMPQQPAKRIPQWLTIDLLVIVVSLAIIGIFIAIDIYLAID
jgi:hypothetical protein